jgi:hypothetical protein
VQYLHIERGRYVVTFTQSLQSLELVDRLVELALIVVSYRGILSVEVFPKELDFPSASPSYVFTSLPKVVQVVGP